MLLEVAREAENPSFRKHAIQARFQEYPDTCTKVYDFPKHPVGFVATRGNKDVWRRFYAPPHKHDGLCVEDCINRKERQLLRLMVLTHVESLARKVEAVA